MIICFLTFLKIACTVAPALAGFALVCLSLEIKSETP